MSKINDQSYYATKDFIGLSETALGAIAKTTKAKFVLTKTALGLDSSIADAVKPSGTTWSNGIIRIKDSKGTAPQAIDLTVSSNSVTTAITDAIMAAFKGEVEVSLQLVASNGEEHTAIARFEYSTLANTDTVRSIQNPA